MQPVISYIRDVRVELSKVVWPKRQDVIKLTLIVFIISGIVGGYVGGLDYLLTRVMSILLTR